MCKKSISQTWYTLGRSCILSIHDWLGKFFPQEVAVTFCGRLIAQSAIQPVARGICTKVNIKNPTGIRTRIPDLSFRTDIHYTTTQSIAQKRLITKTRTILEYMQYFNKLGKNSKVILRYCKTNCQDTDLIMIFQRNIEQFSQKSYFFLLLLFIYFHPILKYKYIGLIYIE